MTKLRTTKEFNLCSRKHMRDCITVVQWLSSITDYCTMAEEAEPSSWADEVNTRSRDDDLADLLDSEVPASQFDLTAFEQLASRVESSSEITPKTAKMSGAILITKPELKGKHKAQTTIQEAAEDILADTMDEHESGSIYQESYASMTDMSSLKAEVASLKSEVSKISVSLEAVLAERAAIPNHLDRVVAKINADMTLMMQKIEDNQIIATRTSEMNPSLAKAAVAEVAASATEDIAAMQSLLRSDPSITGPIVSTSTSLAGKRRFKPVK